MKKGLKHFDIRKYSYLSHITEDKVPYKDTPTCSQSSFCKKRDKCKCIVIEGFGNRILKDFIEFYKNDHHIELIINSSNIYLKKIWLFIGKLVFSWGCGQEKNLAKYHDIKINLGRLRGT